MLVGASLFYYLNLQQGFTFNNVLFSSTNDVLSSITASTELNCPSGSHQLNDSCMANGGSTTVNPLPTPASGNAGSAPNGGSASCWGCVIITDLSGNVVNSRMNPSCYIPNANWGRLGMVIGPNIQGSARTFSMHFTVSAAGGATCQNSDDVYAVYLQNANNIPIYIQSVSPSLPYNVLSGTSQTFTVTFRALDGNYFNDALVLTIDIEGN